MNKVTTETMGIRINQNESYNNYNKIIHFKPSTKKAQTYSRSVMINRYPTNNCQVSSLGQACNISFISDTATKRLDCIMKVFRQNTQAQVLIDVTDRQQKGVLKRFKNYTSIVHTFKYISTNGSIMHMTLLKWNQNI